MVRRATMRLLLWLWEQADNLLALVLAAICGVLGFLGVVTGSILTSAILVTLTILAFALLRDRTDLLSLRHQISRSVDAAPDLTFKQDTNESPLLQGAEREIWLIQETGTRIIEHNLGVIPPFLRGGGMIRIAVALPTEAVARLIALRNDTLTFEAILNRAHSFRQQMASISRDVGADAERIEVRFVPYPIDTTITLVDPGSPVESKRQGVIRYGGFGLHYPEKPDMSLRGEASPRIFAHYFQETQWLFAHSAKIVLLTGEPHAGKTTLMEQLKDSLDENDKDYLYWALSQEILKGNKRTGFQVKTSTSQTTREFATRQSDGEYLTDKSVWAAVADELAQAQQARKILIVDEIGSLQLQCLEFQKVI